MADEPRMPAFRKKYQSWKRRAESMRQYLEASNCKVTYREEYAEIERQPEEPKGKRWWQVGWW